MASYISVKGWIECDTNSIEEIKAIHMKYLESYSDFHMNAEQAALYQSGWIIPQKNAAWNQYVFYGTEIKVYNENFIKRQIKEIEAEVSEIEGKFFFYYEDGETQVLEIFS